MMDVLHFLFEEDFTNFGEDFARSRSDIRDHLYTKFYGVGYSFKIPPRKDARGRVVNASASTEFDYSEYEAALADSEKDQPFSARQGDDAFGPRTKKPTTTGKKIEFVDGDSVPVMQTFNPNEALG